jgi:hypothetical protein
VPINPTPSVNNFTRVVCSGTTVTISPVQTTDGSIIPANTSYSWNSGTVNPNTTINGNNSSGGFVSSFSVTMNLSIGNNISRTVTYSVTPRAGACNGTPFIVTITVNPRAIISEMTADLIQIFYMLL